MEAFAFLKALAFDVGIEDQGVLFLIVGINKEGVLCVEGIRDTAAISEGVEEVIAMEFVLGIIVDMGIAITVELPEF